MSGSAVDELAVSLAAHGARGARVAIVLGSGLGAVADGLEGARSVPFEELQGMPTARVSGHGGRMVLGRLGGVPVLVQQGRVHLYEGWSPAEVTRSVRAFGRLGVEVLILTNAAGGLVPGWPIPTLMGIDDHINLQGRTALAPRERGVASPYHPAAVEALARAAREARIPLEHGVYAGLFGPSYETPAEVRHLARIGAHAVGMSTVQEAQVACAVGLRVAGIACIANPGAGLAAGPLDHGEVVAAGASLAASLGRLLGGAVRLLVE